MTPALLAAARERDEQEADRRGDHEIWPDMAPAVVTFFAMTTQWKKGWMGELLGLDYSQLRPTAEMLGLSLDVQSFHDVRTMESETLRTVRAKRG